MSTATTEAASTAAATEQQHAQPNVEGRLSRARSRAASSLNAGAHRLNLTQTRSRQSNMLAASAAPTPDIHEFSGVFPRPAKGCKPDPPQPLSEAQTAAYAEMLAYFETRNDFPSALQPTAAQKPAPLTQWETLRLLSRESLLRYLRACKWDVAQARRRLIETIAWRREFGVDSLDADELAPEARSGKETVLGFDKHGRPLHYMHPHRNDTKETPRQMQFAVWILERCIDMMPPGAEQLALLINFDHRSRNPTSIANAKLMLYILQNHYVERLGVALCINVPWIFKAFYNAIGAFIDPHTKSKVKFDEAIKSEVPAEQLSADFGGNLDPKYQHDKYWPDLVKTCELRREAMLKRFTEKCGGKIGASEWIILGGDEEEAVVEDAKVLQQKQQQSVATPASEFSVAPGLGPDDPEKEKLERFVTPSENLIENPIDRTFSASGVPTRTTTPKPLETTTELPHAEEAAAAERLSPVPSAVATEHAPSREATMALSTPDRAQTSLEAGATPDSRRKSGFFASLRRGGKHGKEGGRSSGGAKHDLHSLAADMAGAAATGAGAAAAALHKVAKKQEEKAAASAAPVAESSAAPQANGVHAAEATPAAATTNGAAKSKEVKVLLFASAKEAAGAGHVNVAVSDQGTSLADVSTQLISAAKDGEAMKRCLDTARWSVQEEMIDEENVTGTLLRGGEEVAVIPPVSGG